MMSLILSDLSFVAELICIISSGSMIREGVCQELGNKNPYWHRKGVCGTSPLEAGNFCRLIALTYMKFERKSNFVFLST